MKNGKDSNPTGLVIKIKHDFNAQQRKGRL